MFGGFTGLKPPAGTDFGEQMLNRVASQSIRHLFTESDQVDVTVRCFPSSKLLQGSIDNFKMTGRGLVIRRDFRVDEMSFETDAVSIDVGSVFGGQLKLKQPTQAVAQIILSETALNDAFEAQLVRAKLQNLELESLMNFSGGEPISFREVSLKLLPDNGVKIFAKTDLPNRQDVPLAIQATLAVEKRRRILFQHPKFMADSVPEALQGLSETLSMEFAAILNAMVDLDRFDLDGVMLRLNRLETHGQKLHFSGYAQIDHFPGMK
jgi:hypothetical protein